MNDVLQWRQFPTDRVTSGPAEPVLLIRAEPSRAEPSTELQPSRSIIVVVAIYKLFAANRRRRLRADKGAESSLTASIFNPEVSLGSGLVRVGDGRGEQLIHRDSVATRGWVLASRVIRFHGGRETERQTDRQRWGVEELGWSDDDKVLVRTTDYIPATVPVDGAGQPASHIDMVDQRVPVHSAVPTPTPARLAPCPLHWLM